MVGHRPNSEPNLPRAEQFNERTDPVAGHKQEQFRVWLKGGCGNNCHMAAVFERLWNSKHGYEMAKSRHMFKRFFCGWEVEKMASFSRYFQAVANWVWKGVSVTVLALLYDGWCMIHRLSTLWHMLFVPDLKLISNGEWQEAWPGPGKEAIVYQ